MVSVGMDEESGRATSLLRGKIVHRIARHREQEVMIEFDDGSRLYVAGDAILEMSITLSD